MREVEPRISTLILNIGLAVIVRCKAQLVRIDPHIPAEERSESKPGEDEAFSPLFRVEPVGPADLLFRQDALIRYDWSRRFIQFDSPDMNLAGR